MKIPFNPIRFPFHVLRPWVAHPLAWALFFLAPTFNWVRVDMLAQQVIYFGHALPFTLKNLMWLPFGFYGLVLIIALSTAWLGRIFCGWACPHNILTEWTRPVRGALGLEKPQPWLSRWWQRHPGSKLYTQALAGVLVVLIPYALTYLLFHSVLPWSFLLSGITTGQWHPALVMGQALFTLIGVFLIVIGHHFCRSACPYGMAQAFSAYQNPLFTPMEIAYNGDAPKTVCGTCTACQQVCPVDLDPRDSLLKVGEFRGCFNCGECVDACSVIQSYQKKPSLLRFAWEKKTPA
ncbi:MAG: 4Fe-4S binding protein [Vampirovibrionales bacterium]